MKVKLWHWWIPVAANVVAVLHGAVTGDLVAVAVFLVLLIGCAWISGFAYGDDTFHDSFTGKWSA